MPAVSANSAAAAAVQAQKVARADRIEVKRRTPDPGAGESDRYFHHTNKSETIFI